MLKRKIPAQADIFKSKTLRMNRAMRMSKSTGKAIGIFSVSLVVLLGLDALFTTGTTSLKQLASPIVNANQSSDDNNQNNQGGNHNIRYSNNSFNSSGYVNPFYYSQTPLIRDINATPYTNNNFNSPSPQVPTIGNSQNIGALSGQVLSLQQQLAGMMQSCVNNARQGANQILNMKNQAQQMQKAIDNLNNQAGQIDTSTPAGQQQQQNLQNQAQQMQNQLDNLNNNIGQVQDRYNQNNDTCNQNVNQIRQNREDAEGKLDDGFGQAMNISTDLPQQ